MRHKDSVDSFNLSPDGTRMATVSNHQTVVRLWDTITGQILGELMVQNSMITSTVFSLDGTRMAITSSDKIARLWNANTGQLLGELTGHKNTIYSAEFSPNNTRLVTASGDHTARLWDADTGQALGEPMRHDGKVNSAMFSPDSTRVVTASYDESARLWDADTGQILGEPMMHEDNVQSANFSLDGTRVVTAASSLTSIIDGSRSSQFSFSSGRWNGTAHIWDVLPVVSDSDNLLVELAEAVAGLRLGEYGAIETLDDQIERLNQLRQQTANAPLGETTAESFIRWFLSDPWTRTISPLSRTTVPEYIQQELAAGRHEQVTQEFPGHPLLRQEKRTEDSVQHIELQSNPAVPIPAVKPSIPVVN